MCFYYAAVKTNAKALVAQGIIKEEQLSLFPDKPFVSGFEFPLMPVISNADPETIQLFRWGFVPQNTTDIEKAKEFLATYNTLNAKAETVFESRLFADAVKLRRCLVLCSGFFEWRHKTTGKKSSEKYPFYISLKDEGMFVFGGIWQQFTDRNTGEIVNTYAILTTPANGLMEIVHNSKKRMPLIIEPENAMNWLQNDLTENEIRTFFKPFDAEKLKAVPVKKINTKLRYDDDSSLTVYYHYQELSSLMALHPEYFEKTVDLHGGSPTLF